MHYISDWPFVRVSDMLPGAGRWREKRTSYRRDSAQGSKGAKGQVLKVRKQTYATRKVLPPPAGYLILRRQKLSNLRRTRLADRVSQSQRFRELRAQQDS